MNKPEIYNVKSTVTTTTNSLELSGEAIIKAINDAYNLGIPTTANVTVTIPSGGNWSSSDLDIGSDATVDITWNKVEYS